MTLYGHTHPLLHHDIDLTLQYILDFAIDNEKAVALTNIVHSLATIDEPYTVHYNHMHL